MTFQAKVSYDFESVGDGELSVKAGDIVTITNSDVGQGLELGWMGRRVGFLRPMWRG